MAFLTPEQIQQFSELGLLDDQRAQLQHQLQSAQMLRGAPQPKYTTGLGAGLGAIGNALNQAAAWRQEGDVNAQQQALLGKEQAGLAEAMRLANQPLPSAEPQPGVESDGTPTMLRRPKEGLPEIGLPNMTTPEQQQARLGDALRQREGLAQTFMASNHPGLARLGQTLLQQLGRDEDRAIREKGEARQTERDRVAAAQHEATLKEERRWHDLQSGKNADKYERFESADGTVYTWDPRKPDQPPKPMLDAKGNAIKRPPPGAKAKEAPTVPAMEAAKLGEFTAANKMIDELGTAWDGLGSADLAFKAPFVDAQVGTDLAKQYGDKALATAQIVGGIMEGGKLTDADMPKYLRLMPVDTDSADRKKEKVAYVKKMLATKREGGIAGLRAAGFDTSGFKSADDTGPTLDPAVVQHVRSQLQQGETLVQSPAGKLQALAPGEAMPLGYTAVP